MSREATTTIQGKPCRSCGTLTDNATFKERAEFEVKQWRAYKARAAADS